VPSPRLVPPVSADTECELQCVAVCCSVLQCVAVCCSVLQEADKECELQCVAVCCSVLQCVAVCCRRQTKSVSSAKT